MVGRLPSHALIHSSWLRRPSLGLALLWLLASETGSLSLWLIRACYLQPSVDAPHWTTLGYTLHTCLTLSLDTCWQITTWNICAPSFASEMSLLNLLKNFGAPENVQNKQRRCKQFWIDNKICTFLCKFTQFWIQHETVHVDANSCTFGCRIFSQNNILVYWMDKYHIRICG